MGSLALSRVEALDQPAPTIAGEVARIAREQLAPLAAGIDDGSVYPAEVLRRFGEVGAWGSHQTDSPEGPPQPPTQRENTMFSQETPTPKSVTVSFFRFWV